MTLSVEVAERLRAHRERMTAIRSRELQSIAELGSIQTQLLAAQGKRSVIRKSITDQEMAKQMAKISEIITNGSAPTEGYAD